VKGKKRQRAMTLLEITVVLVIVSVMLAITLPSFGPFKLKSERRTSARNLAAIIHYARGAAIYSRRVVKLRIDVEHSRYRLDLMTNSIPASKRDEKDVEPIEAIRNLPEKIYFDRVILYEKTEESENGIVVLNFTPRGTVTAAAIVLADVKGQRVTVDIFGTTGAVEVYAGVPPELQGNMERPS